MLSDKAKAVLALLENEDSPIRTSLTDSPPTITHSPSQSTELQNTNIPTYTELNNPQGATEVPLSSPHIGTRDSESGIYKASSPPIDKPTNSKEYEEKYFPTEQIAALESKWRALPFSDPHFFVSFYNEQISNGTVTLHKWQAEDLEKFGCKPTSQHPMKYCLVTCNGSGKDAFIIASFVAWFCACKVRSRCIVTSSSGVQLTSQTENYIRTLCQSVNEKHGCEIFKIRQRYIVCRLSGSEIRLFATDEEGKAEGYHPMEPNAEMAIVINEAKTVTKEIHRALRRCTGYNYWLEISTPGEPVGDFYNAVTNWPNIRRVTFKDCPHLSLDEYEDDVRNEGEHSAYVRSKWLACFTSLAGETIIHSDLVEALIKDKDNLQRIKFAKVRVGIDIAAGGDENCVIAIDGNKCILEEAWREKDTAVSVQRIDHILSVKLKLPRDYTYIWADDGGIGRAVIDRLVELGWNINRVLNQSAAVNKKRYGNKGAENWQRCARIIEERLFDVSTLSEKCRIQLTSRKFRGIGTKGSVVSGRLFLESKPQAKAEGRPSPDRADSFILSLTGLTVDEFLKAQDDREVTKDEVQHQHGMKFTTQQAARDHFENEVTFENYSFKERTKRKVYNSLQVAMRN